VALNLLACIFNWYLAYFFEVYLQKKDINTFSNNLEKTWEKLCQNVHFCNNGWYTCEKYTKKKDINKQIGIWILFCVFVFYNLDYWSICSFPLLFASQYFSLLLVQSLFKQAAIILPFLPQSKSFQTDCCFMFSFPFAISPLNYLTLFDLTRKFFNHIFVYKAPVFYQ